MGALFLRVYVLAGLFTVGSCLAGIVRAVQSGAVAIDAPSRARLYVIYLSFFVTALTHGVCWPLYWFGILLAKILYLMDDTDPD